MVALWLATDACSKNQVTETKHEEQWSGIHMIVNMIAESRNSTMFALLRKDEAKFIPTSPYAVNPKVVCVYYYWSLVLAYLLERAEMSRTISQSSYDQMEARLNDFKTFYMVTTSILTLHFSNLISKGFP